MKRTFYSVVSFTFLLTAVSVIAGRTELEVIADGVNIRSRPDENSEIVYQASTGDIFVTEKNIEGDWVEIVPPSGVSLWIYAELVREGAVAASGVSVRVGPGINYRSAGKLKKGRKVSIRGKFRDWLKIAPPAGCTVWINRRHVRPVFRLPERKKPGAMAGRKETAGKPVASWKSAPDAALKKTFPGRLIIDLDSSYRPVEAPPKPEPASLVALPVSQKQAVELPEELTRKMLLPSTEQGKVVCYEGVLRLSALVWRRPSRYRLVRYDSRGHAITICYLLRDESQLASIMGQHLIVHGREYWVQGVRYSIVDVEEIVQQD